ncbi:BfmA/BtgA family mobilization protein [Rapidithrix thailandica]|uniref:BfmA/BtgA family mobilization protein n=1 Tax=Rapidithrix thailandica TaxID=413964 RepID=A0AAW9SM71_9BACT
MTKDRQIRIERAVYTQAQQEAKTYQLSLKAYTQAALRFFASRKLNPIAYRPGMEYELSRDLNKAVDRLFGFLITQEKSVLKPLLTETVRSRILLELTIDNLHRVSEVDPNTLQKLKRENEQYMHTVAGQVLAAYFPAKK